MDDGKVSLHGYDSVVLFYLKEKGDGPWPARYDTLTGDCTCSRLCSGSTM